MRQFLQRRRPREVAFFGLVCLLIMGLPIVRRYLLPAYDEWQAVRSTVQMQAVEHAKLTANLAVRGSVDRQFKSLGPKLIQSASDQITLSEYLRELETLARHPDMTLVNMKPLPVKQEHTYKIYRVRLSVAGKLQDIMQFVSDVTHGPAVTGLEAFTLRGAQGHNRVECSLCLWMVRLIPQTHDSESDSTRAVAHGSLENDRGR